METLGHSIIETEVVHVSNKLEQLERLLFWDTHRRPMITNTSDSHQIPSQNKTKSKLQI